MKTIAITQRLILNESYNEVREALDTNWSSLFSDLNFLPIVLPVEYDFENYFNTIKIDGIVLTGGNDLNRFTQSNLSEKRDIFEKKLIEYGIKNNIPILGVCRGMQILAEYFGSTFKKVDNQIAIKHSLTVNQKSKYSMELNNIGHVNSYHSYAVDTISEEFLVSATNKEGMIKAIEHNVYNIFGQMWHSERMSPFEENELAFIQKFFSHY